MANEKRLIDAKNAWSVAQRIYSDPVLLYAIKNVLECTPTVDAVEVVRCKDCKNADYAGCSGGMVYCMEHSCYMDEDGSCSEGEKEEIDDVH